jgi:rhodanese-related sulfurtransferase
MAEHRRDLELRASYWQAKLAAETELMEVVRQVDSGGDDFVLLDARPREAWERERIRGARSAPLDSIEEVSATLVPDRRYVVYCWRST